MAILFFLQREANGGGESGGGHSWLLGNNALLTEWKVCPSFFLILSLQELAGYCLPLLSNSFLNCLLPWWQQQVKIGADGDAWRDGKGGWWGQGKRRRSLAYGWNWVVFSWVYSVEAAASSIHSHLWSFFQFFELWWETQAVGCVVCKLFLSVLLFSEWRIWWVPILFFLSSYRS